MAVDETAARRLCHLVRTYSNSSPSRRCTWNLFVSKIARRPVREEDLRTVRAPRKHRDAGGWLAGPGWNTLARESQSSNAEWMKEDTYRINSDDPRYFFDPLSTAQCRYQ